MLAINCVVYYRFFPVSSFVTQDSGCTSQIPRAMTLKSEITKPSLTINNSPSRRLHTYDLFKIYSEKSTMSANLKMKLKAAAADGETLSLGDYLNHTCSYSL